MVCPMLGNIVLATDFSEASDHAFDVVASMAPQVGAAVVLVHVLSEPGIGSFLGGIATATDEVCEAIATASASLELLANRLRADGVSTATRVLVGPLPDTLASLCRDVSAAILVMGTTPGTDLHNVMLGSVSEQILAEMRIPVMLVPARGTGEL